MERGRGGGEGGGWGRVEFIYKNGGGIGWDGVGATEGGTYEVKLSAESPGGGGWI